MPATPPPSSPILLDPRLERALIVTKCEAPCSGPACNSHPNPPPAHLDRQAAAHEREASKLRAAVAAAEGALEMAAARRADVLEEAAVEQVGRCAVAESDPTLSTAALGVITLPVLHSPHSLTLRGFSVHWPQTPLHPTPHARRRWSCRATRPATSAAGPPAAARRPRPTQTARGLARRRAAAAGGGAGRGRVPRSRPPSAAAAAAAAGTAWTWTARAAARRRARAARAASTSLRCSRGTSRWGGKRRIRMCLL